MVSLLRLRGYRQAGGTVTDDTRRPGAVATREARPCQRSVRRRAAEPVSEMADRQRTIGSPLKSLDTTVL
ncbi:hypothetical protein [Streptomyces mirabilis]